MAIQLPKLAESGIHNLLVLDPSSSHLAYVFITLNLDNKSANISNVGMVWTKASFNKAQRYIYMQAALEYLASNNIKHLYTEAYFSNPKLLTGSVAVIPTINSMALMASYKKQATYEEIGASTWRGLLQIKPITINSKRDYKVPTANKVISLIGQLPETIPSNLDMRERQLPHDLSDALAIALAICKHHGIDQIKLDEGCFRPVFLLEGLAKLSKEI